MPEPRLQGPPPSPTAPPGGRGGNCLTEGLWEGLPADSQGAWPSRWRRQPERSCQPRLLATPSGAPLERIRTALPPGKGIASNLAATQAP